MSASCRTVSNTISCLGEKDFETHVGGRVFLNHSTRVVITALKNNKGAFTMSILSLRHIGSNSGSSGVASRQRGPCFGNDDHDDDVD